MKRIALMLSLFFSIASTSIADEKLNVLLIDGQNNHQWQQTSPVLIKVLQQTGRFHVRVATSPAKGEDLSQFHPSFENIDVVVSNYNGDLWSEELQTSFTEYVQNGGGFVSVHAADNAFPQWQAYNEMIAVGGWGGRNEKSGPYLRIRDGKVVKQTIPGRGGSHGKRHEFLIEAWEADHPILKGLPMAWKHGEDELYDRLRGPATRVTVLATAYSDPSTGGSGEAEPMLMVIPFGKGRVFHTTLGHNLKAMSSVDFQVTLVRGTEWAATGNVTLNDVPADFPTADQASYRNE